MFDHLALLGCVFAAGLLTALWLRHSQQRARQILDAIAAESQINTIPAAVWHINSVGQCTHGNALWRELAGRGKDQWLGLEWIDALHVGDREIVRREWIAAVSREEYFETDWQLDAGDGSRTWLNTRAAPRFDDDGRLLGYCCVSTDVTRAKTREAQLIEKIRSAEHTAVDRISFLGNLSHELRTPIDGVLCHSKLLLDSDLDDDQRAQVLVIADASRLLGQLIDDILDTARIEAGELSLSPEPTDIGQVLNNCVRLLEPMARAKGIKLGVLIDDAVPPLVELDRLRIRQVVSNLIDNAIKFTEIGGVDVDVRIESASGGQHLLISVIDTGIGIAGEKLQLILQTYEQAAPSISRRYGGAGLGLSISNFLAEMMGGTLVVHSKPGVGSNFTVRLPLRECGTKVFRKVTEPAGPKPASEMLKGARILVVDDDQLSRHLVLALAARLGIVVSIAASGEEALLAVKRAQSGNAAFDAVLMDINLPGIDGLEATRRMRSNGTSERDLPIIAFTSNCRPQDIDACRNAGMQAHLAKPLTSVALARELAKCLIARSANGLDDKSAEIRTPLSSRAELQQRYHDRKGELFSTLRRSLERDADRTDWGALASELHRLAGVAGEFGEIELGDASRRLEQRIILTAEPDRCQEHLRRAWPNLERAA